MLAPTKMSHLDVLGMLRCHLLRSIILSPLPRSHR